MLIAGGDSKMIDTNNQDIYEDDKLLVTILSSTDTKDPSKTIAVLSKDKKECEEFPHTEILENSFKHLIKTIDGITGFMLDHTIVKNKEDYKKLNLGKKHLKKALA